MISLKGSILSHSSHGGEGFKAQRRNEIEKWLKEYDIRNYTINDDFTIDVNGNVYLSAIDLKEFPEYIQFGVVRGDFVCRINYLTSLRGVPRIVEGNFDCADNELTSLEGAPKKVGGYFDCGHNKLTSLKGAPENVASFYCSNNKVQFTEEDVREVCKVKGKVIVK